MAPPDGDSRTWRRAASRGPVSAVAVGTLAGADRIVSAGDDGTVRIWDPESALEVFDPLVPHSGTVLGVVTLADHVISVGTDGMLVASQAVMGSTELRAATALASDEASQRDRIGSFEYVAHAVADFLLDKRTEPPVTIGVKGSWGGGKSSLMKMVRERIDPEAVGKRREIELVDAEDGGARWKRLIVAISGRDSELTAGDAYAEASKLAEPAARPRGLSTDAEGVWRPSVWFNPWHYQSGEQIWAGLATSIVEQTTERMSRLERERFFLRLNLARVNTEAVRRTFYDLLWRRVALPLAALAAAAVFVGVAWGAQWAAGGFSLAALLALGGSAVSVLRTPVAGVYPALVESPAYAHSSRVLDDARELQAYVEDPRHRSRVGYTHLAYVDIQRVINLVASRERPLVVFIDDLDRCTPSVVSQTLEALNLFLAGPFRNCSFVIAVEPRVLAAHVAAAYESLVKAIGQETGDEAADGGQLGCGQLGWRFLEKMIHLPVVVPRPTREQAARYLTELLPPVGGREAHLSTASTAPPDEPVATLTPGSPAEATRRHVSLEPTETLKRNSAQAKLDERELMRGSASNRAHSAPIRERRARELAQEPAFHAACRWSAENLVPELNPRRLKRLLAMIQLHALIANRLGYLSAGASEQLEEQLKHIGVLAALNVRWPHIVDRLLGPSVEDPSGPLVVQQFMARDRPDSRGSASFAWLTDDLQSFLDEHREALDMVVRLTTLEPAEGAVPRLASREFPTD